MLLHALSAYYDRLWAAGDPELPSFGFSTEKISFCIVLEPDGVLHSIEDIRDSSSGRPRPIKLVVPNSGGRSVGIRANFLWDNTGYVLGEDGKGRPERTRRTHQAFLALHRKLLPGLHSDSGCNAVLRFLESWWPAKASDLPEWEAICDTNVVFRLRAQKYVHEGRTVRDFWSRFVEEQVHSDEGECLVTGEARR